MKFGVKDYADKYITRMVMLREGISPSVRSRFPFEHALAACIFYGDDRWPSYSVRMFVLEWEEMHS